VSVATPKISHIGMCVTDLERSVTFYCGALGFQRAEAYEFSQGLDAIMEMERTSLRSQFIRRDDGFSIELLQLINPAPTGSRERRPLNQFGLTHLSFYVEDIQATARELAKHGGQVHEHTATDLGFVKLIYCSDPDGIRVELMQMVPATQS
jgi:glyoxylase I family protein